MDYHAPLRTEPAHSPSMHDSDQDWLHRPGTNAAHDAESQAYDAAALARVLRGKFVAHEPTR